MRLSVERIKEGVLHADADARDLALAYFARSYSDDPAIMPLAIQAIDRHGFDEALADYLTDLRQTADSIGWLIDQLQQIAAADFDDGYDGERAQAYANALIDADIELLAQCEARIMALDAMDPFDLEVVTERLRLRDLPVSELWQELEHLSQMSDDPDGLPDEEANFSDRVTEALARHANGVADRVLAILADAGANPIMRLFAIRIAGLMRLDAAVPALVQTLNDPSDWLDLEADCALTRIGTDAAVVEITHLFADDDLDLHVSAAFVLRDIHSDRSVRALLERCRVENSPKVRCFLLQALLGNLAGEAIELARQHILTTPLDPDVLDLRSMLLSACKLMGDRFPEYEDWLADDAAWRASIEENGYKDDEDWLDEEDVLPEEEDARSDDDWERYPAAPPAPTIVRPEPHVGRNDPCPCGSGKKFKKCCLPKGGPPGMFR